MESYKPPFGILKTMVRLFITSICVFVIAERSMAQSIAITGSVFDDWGKKIIGVTILEKGTKNKTQTDGSGNFIINVADAKTAVLIISSLGYDPFEEAIKGRNTVSIKLKSSLKELEEAVVIGYGTVKKKDLTGAVASIRGEELLQTNPPSINQALQGKIAGVVVNQADGAPGAGINIQIRGANSFTTSTEPLYVIDGIPFSAGEAPGTDFATKQTNNPLSLINPKDVVSIDVLKDASATAIYGSRGANGVVIITTKSGVAGKTKVDFTVNTTISNPVRLLKVLDAATYAEYRNEAARNGYKYDGKEYVAEHNLPFPIPGKYRYILGIDPKTGLEIRTDSVYLPSPDDYRNGYMNNGTNWQDQIFQNAISKDYNFGISGGSDKGTFLLSLGHLDQQGIILNSYFKRYNIRSNIEQKVGRWFKFGNYLTASKASNRLARTNSETFGIIPSALGFNPTRTIFDPDQPSGVSEDFSTGLSHPYLYVRTAKNILGTMNIYNSTYGQLIFTDYLSFKQDLGYGYSQNNRDIYYNRYINGGVAPRNGYGAKSDNYYENISLQSMLNFNKTFSVHHRLDGVIGWTFERVFWGGKAMSGSNFPNDMNENNNMGAALIPDPLTSSRGKSSLMSFLGRVNYAYMNKYLLTANYRRDGSSRLSPASRWSNFSSLALAWHLTEEKFIKDLNLFQLLKLRAGYGQTGNQGVSAYATRSRMTAQNYPIHGVLNSGYAEDRWGGPASPNLKWETTNQYNIGLDIGVMDGRISFIVDLYQKNTSDLLQYAFIPLSTGFSTIATNYGNVNNRGLELTGSFQPLKKGNLSWRIDGNVSFNRNKIGGLDADQFSDVVWGIESMFLRRNGHAIGTLYGYKENGYYDNEAEVRADPALRNESDAKIRSMIGQVKYLDTNGDGIIDDRDKMILGNTNPDFTYGVTNNITFKSFSFSFFLQGVKGNDILNANLRPYDMAGITNMPLFVWENRWTEDNHENAQFPRADLSFTRRLRASDRLIEDGSYFRLKNVSLSYQLSKPWDFLERINFTFSANNLFTITKYRWYDPDVNAFGGDASRRGVDMASYPSARTYTFGIQAIF